MGRRLWRGYEYVARLQYIDANPWLCPGIRNQTVDEKYNITVPSDGVPVALLVKGGSCALVDKAEFGH